MNSADINSDGVVEILDVTTIAGDKGQRYNEGVYFYRSALNWDGEIDGIDANMSGEASGQNCAPE